MEQLHALLD